MKKKTLAEIEAEKKAERKAAKEKAKLDTYIKRLAKRGITYNPKNKTYGVVIGGITRIMGEQEFLESGL